jgi:hypothetical protein
MRTLFVPSRKSWRYCSVEETTVGWKEVTGRRRRSWAPRDERAERRRSEVGVKLHCDGVAAKETSA